MQGYPSFNDPNINAVAELITLGVQRAADLFNRQEYDKCLVVEEENIHNLHSLREMQESAMSQKLLAWILVNLAARQGNRGLVLSLLGEHKHVSDIVHSFLRAYFYGLQVSHPETEEAKKNILFYMNYIRLNFMDTRFIKRQEYLDEKACEAYNLGYALLSKQHFDGVTTALIPVVQRVPVQREMDNRRFP